MERIRKNKYRRSLKSFGQKKDYENYMLIKPSPFSVMKGAKIIFRIMGFLVRLTIKILVKSIKLTIIFFLLFSSFLWLGN